MLSNSNQVSEDAVGIKLALSEASMNDLDVTYVQLGKPGGLLQTEVEGWVPSFDGKMTALVRQSSFLADNPDLDVRSVIVPEKIKVGELGAFLIAGNEISIFQIGSRIYIQTEKEFLIESNRIINLIGTASEKHHELNRLIAEEEEKNA